VGKEDKLQETLDEAARVRADFGYPIMVTPLSQFVVSQAAINVIVGERYKEATDQLFNTPWDCGARSARADGSHVKDKILSRGRAKEWQGWEPPEPSLEEVRRKFGFASDEELLLRSTR
jgi:oxaloacetate decarboxylase alpha subunit